MLLSRLHTSAWSGRQRAWRGAVHSHRSLGEAVRPSSKPKIARKGHDSLPLVISTGLANIDVEELADLLGQAASYAPSQSFHASRQQHGNGGTAAGNGGAGGHLEETSSSSNQEEQLSAGLSCGPSPQRLRAALRRSSICVAAFLNERYLPPHQHLSSRGLGGVDSEGTSGSGSWWRGPRQRRVLVGFARAVGDATLVATVHDVVVMPELRGRGLGRQLLERLTKELYFRQGVIDVGLLAPDPTVPFLEACSFGPDPEESTTCMLSPEGLERWRAPAWEFKPRPGLAELLLRSQTEGQ